MLPPGLVRQDAELGQTITLGDQDLLDEIFVYLKDGDYPLV